MWQSALECFILAPSDWEKQKMEQMIHTHLGDHNYTLSLLTESDGCNLLYNQSPEIIVSSKSSRQVIETWDKVLIMAIIVHLKE